MGKKLDKFKKSVKAKFTKKNILIATGSVVIIGAILHLGGYKYLHNIFSSRAGGAAVDHDEGKDITKFQKPNLCSKHYPWGPPQVKDAEVNKRSLFICRNAYAVQFDPKLKVPLWQVDVLRKINVVPFNIPSSFVPMLDPEVPSKMQASLSDYARSNYYLGYLAPIENMYKNQATSEKDLERVNRQNLTESLYLTNAVPETREAAAVKKLIDANARSLVIKTNRLFMISGPVYLNGQTNGFIGVGNDKIPVPTHLFKIMTNPNKYGTLAYLIPNKKLDCGFNCNPATFLVPLQEVERVTGIEFFSGLAPSYAVELRRDRNEYQRKINQIAERR